MIAAKQIIVAAIVPAFVPATIFLKPNQASITREIPAPPHLCQYNASTSYPCSLDRNSPINAVHTEKNAEKSKIHSPIFKAVSAGRIFLWRNRTQATYNRIKTIGK